jgi:hypothetical protein
LPLLLVAALLGPLVARAGALVIGIGDQTAQMFTDQRFKALGIHYARLSVAWDTLEIRWQRAYLDEWLKDARADGVHPLISFDHSRLKRRTRKLPSPAQLAHEFRVLRARYPWVKDFAAWNEANFCGEATCHHPALVAAYYRALRNACRSCNILGAELLDMPNMVPWVRQFDHALGYDPAIWGLHNYLGANRLQIASTRTLLNATHGQIWFTETGGVVSRNNHSPIGFTQSAAHAAVVTKFVFTRLVPLSKRITRVYIYQWNGAGSKVSWDSGLIAPNGRTRPAFTPFIDALRHYGLLSAAARAKVTALARVPRRA